MAAEVNYNNLNVQINAAFRKYLLKVMPQIAQLWDNYMTMRVYDNVPNAYLPTHALEQGFNAQGFVDSFSLVISPGNFQVIFSYIFDNQAVAAAHAAQRGSQTLSQIMVPLSNGKTQSLDRFMVPWAHYNRSKRGVTPLAYDTTMLASLGGGGMKGSMSPVNVNNDYFAQYFIAGPNSKGQPLVYAYHGNRGITTAREDKHEIITDFLIQLGLIPSQDSMTPPHGGDWNIRIDMNALELTFKNDDGTTTSTVPVIGCLIEVFHRVVVEIAKGGKGVGGQRDKRTDQMKYYLSKAINNLSLMRDRNGTGGGWGKQNPTAFREYEYSQREQYSGSFQSTESNPLAGLPIETLERVLPQLEAAKAGTITTQEMDPEAQESLFAQIQFEQTHHDQWTNLEHGDVDLESNDALTGDKDDEDPNYQMMLAVLTAKSKGARYSVSEAVAKRYSSLKGDYSFFKAEHDDSGWYLVIEE